MVRCFLINEDGGYHNVIRWFLINEDGGYLNVIISEHDGYHKVVLLGGF